MIDIDEQSSKGKLALSLLRELGLKTTEINYALASSRKISHEELINLLDEDESSETLQLKQEINKYKANQ